MESKERLKFIVIKTKEQGMFISDNVQAEGYFNSKIPKLFFDGSSLVGTFKKDWYKINNIPEKVERQGNDTYSNERYELKAGFPISDLTPKTISYDDFDSESEVRGLYTFERDIVKGDLEEVDFEWELLSEEDNFYLEKPKYPSTPLLIIALTTHPSLQLERPCSISGKDLYKVIRNHIKVNINPKYARISSDYDFCLSVEKVIAHEPESYQVNVGKRRPKYEVMYRRNRTIKIFETSPQGYSSYPKQDGISAKNQRELEEKIDAYLEKIINYINKPLIECSHCGGQGVILDK